MALFRIRILGYYVCECGRANGLAPWGQICGTCMVTTRLIESKQTPWPGRFHMTSFAPWNESLEWFPNTPWFADRNHP